MSRRFLIAAGVALGVQLALLGLVLVAVRATSNPVIEALGALWVLVYYPFYLMRLGLPFTTSSGGCRKMIEAFYGSLVFAIPIYSLVAGFVYARIRRIIDSRRIESSAGGGQSDSAGVEPTPRE